MMLWVAFLVSLFGPAFKDAFCRVKFLASPFFLMLFWTTVAACADFRPHTALRVLLCFIGAACFCLFFAALQVWYVARGHASNLSPRRFAQLISWAAILDLTLALILLK